MARYRIDPAGWLRMELLADRVAGNVAEDVAEDMRGNAAVDTGLMKSSVVVLPRVTLKVRRIHVGGPHPGGAFYWYFVEYGTENMRAQPFARPAVYRHRVVKAVA